MKHYISVKTTTPHITMEESDNVDRTLVAETKKKHNSEIPLTYQKKAGKSQSVVLEFS